LHEGDDAVAVSFAWRSHSAGKLNTAVGPARPRKYELVAGFAVERRGADIAQLASLAGRAAPDAIEQLLDAIQQAIVRARETELEVAPPRPLRPQPRTGPVGAADIDERAIDDDRLEMHAWTGAELQL